MSDSKQTGLLSGIRVLDLSRVMSGPFCTSMLADLGAEVIKIEMPSFGDEARHFGPFQDGESTYFMLLNRNKKSVTVNMKTAEGRALLESLIPKCDVLVENFRPGVMARLGLDEPKARTLNSDIIYTSISGFGQESPLKDWPAFDLVICTIRSTRSPLNLVICTMPSAMPPLGLAICTSQVYVAIFV